jgi:hypothetical protein
MMSPFKGILQYRSSNKTDIISIYCPVCCSLTSRCKFYDISPLYKSVINVIPTNNMMCLYRKRINQMTVLCNIWCVIVKGYIDKQLIYWEP